MPPHQIAPYYQPSMYGAPRALQGLRADGRAQASLLVSSVGLILALTAFMLGATATLIGLGDLLLGLLLGIPAMVLGPIGYFFGRSALERITASQGAVGGRGTATSGWAIGVAATALGATATLIALVLFLLANFGQPPA